MWSSWIVVLHALEDGVVYNSARSMLKSLKPYLADYTGYTCSGFLKKNRNKTELSQGEKVVIRFSSLNPDILATINMVLFRHKIMKTSLVLDNVNFKVCAVNECLQQFSIDDLPTNFPNSYYLTLLSPTFFKVGDIYIADISYAIKNIISMYKKFLGASINLNAMEEIKSLPLQVISERDIKCYYNSEEVTTIKGEYVVDASHISDCAKHALYLLMEFARYNGVGYKTSEGFGVVDFIN
ncbi:MAG: hypothetical protein ATN33_02275 [Epulopiscium sp. Nele67-Bin001]|nr:MAG: hypothetical protein ATN33_02275 [Epulopiscium sp. Nele67-Bin001]